MNSANNWFAELERLTDRLHRNAKSIRFVRMAGVKEAAHLVTEHTFRGLFADINQHIVGSLSQCSELRVQVHRAKSVVAIVNQTKSSLGEQSQALRRSCDRLPVPA
jgi:aerotaxis receptor